MLCPKCKISEMECSCPQWHGNIPANPYPQPTLRLEDRDGYPFKKVIHPVAPSTRAQVKIGWLFDRGKGTATTHD